MSGEPVGEIIDTVEAGPWKLYPRPDVPDSREARWARGGYVPGSGSVVARLYDGELLIGSDGRVWKVVRK